jgi:hypothetical protein
VVVKRPSAATGAKRTPRVLPKPRLPEAPADGDDDEDSGLEDEDDESEEGSCSEFDGFDCLSWYDFFVRWPLSLLMTLTTTTSPHSTLGQTRTAS